MEIFRKDINLQSGAPANQKITVPTIDASAKSMGISNLDVSSFDTDGAAMTKVQSAESRIRDTDMADEMQKLSTVNILESASDSMLAQANSSLQNVLALLQ
ncbi:MAG: flagellin [Bacteroides sp.]